jgi:hypothetical protein
MPARKRRVKISTTIAPENGVFLRSLVRRGKAANFAEVFDTLLEDAQAAENRERLEKATEAYFASLSSAARDEETQLGEVLAYEAGCVNFDE